MSSEDIKSQFSLGNLSHCFNNLDKHGCTDIYFDRARAKTRIRYCTLCILPFGQPAKFNKAHQNKVSGWADLPSKIF